MTLKRSGFFLGAWALVHSAISHKPKINSRKVQGERTGAGSWQDGITSEGFAVIKGEAQGGGGSGQTVNGAAELARRMVQVEVPTELRADVRTHGF